MMKRLVFMLLFVGTITANSHYQDLLIKANKAFSKGKHEKAITLYRQLIEMNPHIPQVHFNLGFALHQQKEYAQAIDHYKKAIKLKPTYAKAYFHLGKLLQESGNKQEAQLMYYKTHEENPSYFDVYIPLAELEREQNHFDKAIELYLQASELRPDHIEVMFNLANIYNTNHQPQEALQWYNKILEIIPNNPSILYNIAYTLKKMNRLPDALPYYKRVLTMEPQQVEQNNHHQSVWAETHFSYGLALLLTGNRDPERWQRGWQEYEWRWRRNHKIKKREYSQPMWDGSDLHGKTLFLWAEQGLGDTFEFIRYAYVAKELGAQKVIVAVQKPLLDLMAYCPYIDQVISIHDQPPYFDVHAPLLSMPYLTKTSLYTVPAKIPYLFADEELMQEWKELLSEDTNFKIGICWQGNPNYSTQFLRMAVAAKSMSVTKFLPIISLPGVSVYSLQKMTGTDQLSELPADAQLRVFDEDFDTTKGRFMDTAAVMKQLDLVVTIDTSICHLAAALGVPTWNLLPKPPDWRWMLDCDDSPWYPNMRLFRQPTTGDWDSVIATVVEELKAHLQYKKPLITHTNSYKANL